MATSAEIAAFRLLIGQPEDAEPYTDQFLSARLDSAASDQALAAVIWREKAASFSELVDVSESGSSRKLSDLYKNALTMAAAFEGIVPTDDSSVQSGVRVKRLTRR
jgi:hypothetical protein